MLAQGATYSSARPERSYHVYAPPPTKVSPPVAAALRRCLDFLWPGATARPQVLEGALPFACPEERRVPSAKGGSVSSLALCLFAPLVPAAPGSLCEPGSWGLALSSWGCRCLCTGRTLACPDTGTDRPQLFSVPPLECGSFACPELYSRRFTLSAFHTGLPLFQPSRLASSPNRRTL